MAFMDKVKAAAKNTGDYADQKAEEGKILSKISDQKSIKNKAIDAARDMIYAAYKENGATAISDEAKAEFDKAIAAEKEIEKLEQERKDLVDAREKGREARWEEAKKDDESSEKKDEAPAEEKKE